MPSLQEQLLEILPKVLPRDPEKAIGGVALLAAVKPMLAGEYAENSIRQTFSDLSQIPDSPIARRTGKFGYYLRSGQGPASATEGELSDAELTQPGRHGQPEEKFRAIFCKFVDLSPATFSRKIEHTAAKKVNAGLNRWKFPDVVVLDWDPAVLKDDGTSLAGELLGVMQATSDQPFVLESVELKVDVPLASLREVFFQCVSNSRWAHKATLAIAKKIQDESVSAELRRLGTSYGINVVSFGLSQEYIDALPSAESILRESDKQIEERLDGVSVYQIASVANRESLDWDHLSDIRQQHQDFVRLFEWIAHSLQNLRVRPFDAWSQLMKL